MRFESSHLLICVASLALLCMISEAALGGVGGWTQIKNVKDSHVIEVGKFAVNEYNKKSKTSLKFVSVVSGESQVVAGVNYKLVLGVKDGKAVNKYKAVVYERAWQHYMNLTSFQLVK